MPGRRVRRWCASTPIIFPYDPVHQTFINVYENDELRHQVILDYGRSAVDYYAGSWQGTTAVLGVFIPAGIEHILIGPDHILFLVGLLLLGGSLWQLTTYRHGLHDRPQHHAVAGGARRPVAAEQHHRARHRAEHRVRRRRQSAGAARRKGDGSSRWAGATASASRHATFARGSPACSDSCTASASRPCSRSSGCRSTALGWSLFSFNFGVEIGQLGIVLVVASALAAIRRRSEPLNRRLVFAGSVIVILAGGYWFVQRVFLTGGV